MHPIYAPLNAEHPLVKNQDDCPLCKKPFCPGERTVLLSINCEIVSTVQAVAVHASCGLKGVRTEHGEIDYVKDGDASPYPVVTTDGKQWKFEELGLSGR